MHNLIILQVNVKQNKREDGGSSGGVIQKTVASFQRKKITEWYTWSSQLWDATTEETIKRQQLTSIGEKKDN